MMDLIGAAKNGNFELAFNLLQSGYSADVVDKDKATPLYWSACHGYASICEILIQAGSDVNTRVKWGSTPLHASADRGHKACIEILLDSGSNVNARNNRGDTALHIAAYRGHYDIIMTLLRAKADVNVKNEKGKTPQQEALEGGHRKIAENIKNFQNMAGFQGATNLQPLLNGQSKSAPHSPEMRPSRFLRQASEYTDDRTAQDYGYAISPKRMHGHLAVTRQGSVGTVPPRPAVALSRSISFSGNHGNQSNGYINKYERHLEDQTDYRTNSLGSIPGYDVIECLNDVNRGFTSVDFSELPIRIPQSDSSSPTSSYFTESSAYSSDVSCNNTSLVTSASENEPIESSDYPTPTSPEIPVIPPRLRVQSSRPNRASIGSMREITNGANIDAVDTETSQQLIANLQKRLVESYRSVENLTIENESLKFKSKTLLKGLSDAEQSYNEKMRECEDLRQQLEAKNRELAELEVRFQRCPNGTVSTSEVVQDSKNGLNCFCEHLNKELSDESLQDVQEILRSCLQNHVLRHEQSDTSLLDAPHREWVPGVDYVILGIQPIHEQNIGGHFNSYPHSLSFPIKHLKTGKKLQLKIFLRRRKRSLCQLDENELDILDKIGDHKNIVKILHSYEGSIERFKKFVPVSFSNTDSLDDLSCRTTFIVTDQITPLRSFIANCADEIRSNEATSRFLVHAFYQLITVLCLLDELNIAHNNISEDSIFISEECQPVLANFDYSTCMDEKQTSINKSLRHPAEHEEMGDYVNVTHLARGSEPTSMTRETRAKLSDLERLCKVFENLLLTNRHQPDNDVSCFNDDTWTNEPPRVVAGVLTFISGVLSQSFSLSTSECLQRLGFYLFGPKPEGIKSQYECRTAMQTAMLHLLSKTPGDTKCGVTSGNNRAVLLRRAINKQSFENEVHFLCNITSQQMWKICRTLES